MVSDTSATDVREEVRQRYAEAAAAVDAGCCGGSCGPEQADAFTSGAEGDFGTWRYEAADLIDVPDGAAEASLGCGNPTAVAELRPGETVLDLGSGAGMDVLLSATRVGPEGFAYGIDMTDEMLALARKHQREAGAANVEFRKGLIEDLPIEDSTIDVVISNCVINLSADKPRVIAEMFRVLRPGGRIGIADVVADDELTHQERLERGSWVGCIAGALGRNEWAAQLEAVGFVDVSVDVTHSVADGMHSAIIKAVKPGVPALI